MPYAGSKYAMLTIKNTLPDIFPDGGEIAQARKMIKISRSLRSLLDTPMIMSYLLSTPPHLGWRGGVLKEQKQFLLDHKLKGANPNELYLCG